MTQRKLEEFKPGDYLLVKWNKGETIHRVASIGEDGIPLANVWFARKGYWSNPSPMNMNLVIRKAMRVDLRFFGVRARTAEAVRKYLKSRKPQQTRGS